ncbi:MAG: Uma2 family endonuclease [Chloroflexi bacterium]|nr:Uma2 family endonuclease [Chloroflexota bacterium]
MLEPIRPTIDEIEYPESDGEPMGESGIHVLAILHLLGALRYLLHQHLDIYVIADMFLYYEEGKPRSVRAPDVMVIKGVDASYERKTFKTWEEEAVPSVVIEVTSQATAAEDLTTKYYLYESLGVSEYFLFDPLEEYIQGQLRGFRLVRNRYTPIRVNRDGTLTSQELHARLQPEDYLLRVVDPVTNTPVPGLTEAMYETARAMARAEQEAQRAEQEARRADQAQAETERLKGIVAELEQRLAALKSSAE